MRSFLSLALVLLLFVGFSQRALVAKETECDLQKSACEVFFGKHKIIFDLKPKPVRAMQELTIEIQIDPPLQAEELLVDFTMPEMYMGENKAKVKKILAAQYEGKIILPRCKKTLWQAEVIDLSTKKTLAKILFHIKNR
ncbi:MAG: hypothetical protein N2Z40_03230 [Caldimicrobium sp.]|nr:hypothetical protein [Caldimicrobium sp.]MCX7613220.1 hypothetical protein [Caldimicrobium sp.]MDW8182478.1 hypothetical protein [Caldimicrobium sp.]